MALWQTHWILRPHRSSCCARTPNPFPDWSGPSVAIVANDEPYLIDFGSGVVRQASAMSPEYAGSVEGLAVKKIKHAFLTHLHSDHTSTAELGRLAAEVKPKLLIFYHLLLWGSTHETRIDEVKSELNGTAVSARHLDIF